MKPLEAAALSLASVIFGSSTRAEGIQITAAGSTPTLIGGAKHFSGQVAVGIKAAGDSVKHAGVGMGTFMPGACTAWHTHPLGETLLVTAGFGLVGRSGGQLKEIRPGDSVWIEPGEKRWHGASPDCAMTHIAIA